MNYRSKSFLTGLVITCAVILAGSGNVALAQSSWTEDFDDGDMSDWTFVNPTPGDNAVTMEPSTDQSISLPYSFKASGANADFYGGRATGPLLSINLSEPYTISFSFRYESFHWYGLVLFGPVNIAIDNPSLEPAYYNGSSWNDIGTETFQSYCPSGTWTDFRIEVDPTSSSYHLYVDDSYKGTADYGTYDTGYTGFTVREYGGDAPSEPDYVSNAYYDDLSIAERGPIPTVTGWGLIVLALLLAAAATIVIHRRRRAPAL